MQIDASKSQGFAFSYTTSSGKNLSFAMFDKSELSVSKDASSTSLSLTREYGYSFSYEGSKLTNEDLAEIKNAMQELSPSINEFLQSSKVGEMNPREVISSAMKMADLLPSSSDENFTQASFSSLANKINELLNKNKCQQVSDYKDINVSDKIVKIIQSYTNIINKVVWKKY